MGEPDTNVAARNVCRDERAGGSAPPEAAMSVIEVLEQDNTPEGLAALLDANRRFRLRPWPSPYHQTRHRLRLGDARDLSWLANESVHLVVTSPPYWTLKKYAASDGQMG